MNELSKGV